MKEEMTGRAWIGVLGIIVILVCLYVITVAPSLEHFNQVPASTIPVQIVSEKGEEVVRNIYDSSCDYIAANGKITDASGLLTKASLYDGSKESEDLYAPKLKQGHQRCYVKLEQGEACSKSNRRVYSQNHSQLVTNVETVDLGPFFGNRCSVVLKQGLPETDFTQYINVYKDALLKDLRQQQAAVQKDISTTESAVASLQASITTESNTVDTLSKQRAQQKVEYEELLRRVKEEDQATQLAQQRAKEAELDAENAKKEAAAKAALAPPPPPPPPPQPVQVTFYQHCDYTGWKVTLGRGRYAMRNLRTLGFIDNDASSLTFDRGSGKVILWSEDDYRGSSIIITSNVRCLVDNGFNDTISSIEIE